MNCLEFRRRILTEPANRDSDYIRHLEDCAECSRFARGADQFERDLRQAMEVAVPIDVASRIKLERTIRDDEHRRHRAPLRYAIAASVLLTAGVSGYLGYGYYELSSTTQAFKTAVLGHIYMEAHFLEQDLHMQPAAVNQVLAPFGGLLDASFGPVNQATNCPINDRLGAHFVVPGQIGPVSIIYVPEEQTKNGARFSDLRFDGVMVKTGTGSMAVVGERGEPLERTLERVEKNLSWMI